MSAIGGVLVFGDPEVPVSSHAGHIMDHMPHRGRIDEGYMVFDGSRFRSYAGTDTNPQVRGLQPMPELREAPASSWMVLGHRLGGIFPDFHPGAHQPYTDHNEQVFAVLDGEIFNAFELSRQLQSEGIQMETSDPVEVLVKGYMVWNERILSMLEGSFSFVLYDRRENRLFGARDPFGVKPLYYVHNENCFAFGSELKSLFGLPFVSKKISKSAVYDYLILGLSETSVQSMFRGCSELMPGTAFSCLLPKGNLKVWSFFNLVTDSKIDRYSRNKVSTLSHRLRKALVANASQHITPGITTAYRLAPELENFVFPYLLKESIREIRAADRPDPGQIYQAISGTIYGEGSDSGLYDTVTRDLGVELIRSACTFRDFTSNLLKVCYQQDLPFTSLDVFGQYKMLEAAREHQIRIVIESSGGTQLFSNGEGHFSQYLQDILTRGNYSQFFENLFNSPGSFSRKMGLVFSLSRKLLFRTTSDDIKESLFKNNQEEFSYIKDDFKDRYAKNLENSIKKMPESLNQLLANEFAGPVVKEILRTTDRNSQYLGVEVRLPFVSDRSLADSMIKSNSVYKIRAGHTGNLLRRAMRGVFPDFLMQDQQRLQWVRRENRWLMEAREDLREFITPDLDDFIDSRKVKQDWDQLFNHTHRNRSEFLWRVINLGIWRHVYFN